MSNGNRIHNFLCAIISMIILCSPGLLRADDQTMGDTSIYNASVTGIKANVLIIFDLSGSMHLEPLICENPYNPYYDYINGAAVTTPTTAMKRILYYRSDRRRWDPFPSSTGQITYDSITNCSSALAGLRDDGWWEGRIRNSSPYTCSNWYNYYELRTANFNAFMNSTTTGCGTSDYKINVARESVITLLQNMQVDGEDTVNWGLMVFPYSTTNYCMGGNLIHSCGTPSGDSSTSGTIIYTLTHNSRFQWQSPAPNAGTPQAESLAEAGLYFAGQRGWARTSTYTSPIQYRCQKNYIIMITDGNSQCDMGDDQGGTSLFQRIYLNNLRIGDYDGDGCDPNGSTACGITFENQGSHYLDDVAKFLHDQDLINTGDDANGISYEAEDYPDQTITTYTIGFGEDQSGARLLTRAAQGDWDGEEGSVPASGNYGGGGKFYEARNSTDLIEALRQILGNVNEENSNFISPVVPVSKMNRVYSGNSIYLGLFRPWDGGTWRGNLKKFGIDDEGLLRQKSGAYATDSGGNILEDSVSCWNTTADGQEVDEGGVGEVLLSQTNRVFLTYNPTTAIAGLTSNTNNLFNQTNTTITYTTLGVGSDTERNDLIDFIRAEGVWSPTSTYDTARSWIMGDVLHSRPAVMYDGNKTILFVGANDGFLHCFVDDDQGDTSNLANDTVTEAWCFTPWELLPTLKELHPTLHADEIHNYYVDGSPVLYTSGTNKYLTFGLRRGGSSYYTLDVGDVNTTTGELTTGTYATPSFAWKITSTVLGSSGEALGESWFKPVFCKLKTASGQTSATYPSALLFTGGYDNDNQDLDGPSTSGDTKGRAIFALNPATGAVLSNFNFSHTGGQGNMDFSIVDMIAFDAGNNGCIDTVYAGDLGGRLHAFKDRDGNGGWTDNGSPLYLFNAADTAATATKYLKFFYAPDVVLESFGDYVYIGSGDREHPNETDTVNRFYAVKNFWPTTGTPITESTLTDVSTYAYETTYPTYWLQGDECKGWYIRMPHTGEKVVSSPLVYNGVVYFTSFVPEAGSTATDACKVSELGNGYVWAVNYLTGEAIFNFNTSNDTTDSEGNTQAIYDASDRYKMTSQGMPTQPTLIVTSTGAKVLIGTDKGVITLEDPTGRTVNRYFWRQN